jgi:anti-sigma factor RsiW
MHNCKRTRDALIELALGELNEEQSRAIRSELHNCEACRAEQTAIAGTLRVSRQALSAEPGSDEFWRRYHSRLQDRVKGMPVVASSPGAGFLNGLRAFTTSSVRIPLPAALAAVALIGVLSFAAISRGPVTQIPATPIAQVEVQTVHVPVVQEKVVRQLVYRDRKRSKPLTVDYANLNTATATAKPVTDPAAKLTLVGFKPADEVKLTIIKGNDQDEK